MHGFSEHQLLGAFFAIAAVLFICRGMAELCRRLHQPEVLGDLLGGFLLGPSIFGALFPHAFHALFLNPAVSLALQLISWIGAILLLMIAGMEADLAILRQKVTPGLLAAFGAIVSAISIGTVIGLRLFHAEPTTSFFLGLVLSVTAVSVVAKLLIEREALRRDYAQVLLAAGIASEVLVWPLISITSAVQHHEHPVLTGLRATALAILFFAVMFTVGRRLLYWAMRRVADNTGIANAELSLVLVLLCLSAATTTLLGLHPLLGAFVFGVLLGKAPRASVALKERIQAIAIALFAPVFFGLAGMRVNLFNLRGLSSIRSILLLLVIAGAVKVLFGFLGALAGRLPVWEAATVGIGLNLKGGTDVVVAIIGTQLLLFPSDLYTTYAVVAILTVVLTPPLLNLVAARSRPGDDELKRLNREEARRLAYLADRERILFPLAPSLFPALSAPLLAAIAATKHREGELCDVTELSLEPPPPESSLAHQLAAHLPHLALLHPSITAAEKHATAGAEGPALEPTTPAQLSAPADRAAASLLAHSVQQQHLSLQRVHAHPGEDLFPSLERVAEGQQLLAIGATEATGDIALSFGPEQDRILREVTTDVLVTLSPAAEIPPVRRILVPLNGLRHSLSAADVAAYIARGTDAEIVLFSVVAPRLGPMFWRERKHRDLLQAGYTITRAARARIDRLDVRQSEKVLLHADPAEATLDELRSGNYDLIVLGSVMRSCTEAISLGRTVEHLLQAAPVPRVLLVSRDVEVAAA